MPGWLWLRGRLNRLRVTVGCATLHSARPPPPPPLTSCHDRDLFREYRPKGRDPPPTPLLLADEKIHSLYRLTPRLPAKCQGVLYIGERYKKVWKTFKNKGTVSRGFNFKEWVCCLYVLNIKYFIFLERKKEPQKWWLVRLCVQNKPNKKSKLSLGQLRKLFLFYCVFMEIFL